MKKNDLILLIGAIIISVIIILCFVLFLLDGSADVVNVTVDGKKVAIFALDTDVEYLISSADGGENLLIIKDGKAFISEANCPDKICVRTGCAEELKPITCLPNKVVITIEKG